MPALSEQRRIVEILDQADQLRRLRAEADGKAERILPTVLTRTLGAPSTWQSSPRVRPLAEIVIFVDPYFRPGRPQNRRPLEAFLRAVLNARPLEMPSRIEVHTSADEGHTGPREFFQDGCRRSLPRCVPEGVRLVILRLRERPGGQRLHNRYILTDVGGLIFGGGLDEGAAGEIDDVSLMDRPQYELRWSQHATEPMAFDVTEVQIEIQSGR